MPNASVKVIVWLALALVVSEEGETSSEVSVPAAENVSDATEVFSSMTTSVFVRVRMI
jgi:hypothetical protein